ncbi:MBL fold metallo-hydrolase [Caulobacter sp. 17J65-9]|uniref:MBL fold metallo-hydrolase n=1 Tax=Caulobacter sp. 17J65-9 TaxID=2709382 RepID=UPI0013C86D9A|nr:MBL fold metallo-hydrolase [Caulobacter sp. 17J65-9]NEX94517.1 MBL fold metallo-hydrolase [Caulobacter sp. 17J65-9]
MSPDVQGFFDTRTSTVTYLVSDPATKAAAVIDPVLDFDAKTGRVWSESVDAVLKAAGAQGLRIERVLETHAHADHLSGAQVLKRATGARLGVGGRITEVQKTFAPVFGANDVAADGSAFDDRFADGETFLLGQMDVKVMHTPGHTPACVTYLIGDAAFVGDTLFMPDFGTARCDFPGGDARTLYRSIHRILALPPKTRVFVGHDYPSGAGREAPAWETTVAAEKSGNKHVGADAPEDAFVQMRTERDATLDPPALLMPSLQVNIRAGALPPAEADGRTYLKTPLKISL